MIKPGFFCIVSRIYLGRTYAGTTDNSRVRKNLYEVIDPICRGEGSVTFFDWRIWQFWWRGGLAFCPAPIELRLATNWCWAHNDMCVLRNAEFAGKMDWGIEWIV